MYRETKPGSATKTRTQQAKEAKTLKKVPVRLQGVVFQVDWEVPVKTGCWNGRV